LPENKYAFQTDYFIFWLRELIALAEGVRELARSGSMRMIVSEHF